MRARSTVLKFLVPILLGGYGGVLAGQEQAAWGREDPFYGDYSDEKLAIWLAAALLGPALLVLLYDVTGASSPTREDASLVTARRVTWSAILALLPAMIVSCDFGSAHELPGAPALGSPAFRVFAGTALTFFVGILALWPRGPIRSRITDRAFMTLGVSITVFLGIAYAFDLHLGPMPRFHY